MSPEEHYAEAERLVAIARSAYPIGAPIGYETHRDVAALAQLHATLALYRPPVKVEQRIARSLGKPRFITAPDEPAGGSQ